MKNVELLESVLADVLAQVTKGKGAERHGKGNDFLDQPWREISDDYGEGFLLGQTAKKMKEATHAVGWEHKRWETEMLGAMAYLAFAIVKRRLEAKDLTESLLRTDNEPRVFTQPAVICYEPGLPGAEGREHW